MEVAVLQCIWQLVDYMVFIFQERAAGALANLAADDKCSTEVATAGGVHALVMLARNCKFEGVQEQVALHFIIWVPSSSVAKIFEAVLLGR